MQMSRTIVREFNPVIYPYKIWIVINKTPDIIAENFYEYNGNPVRFVDNDGNTRQEAFTMMAISKDNECYGTVIFFRSKKSMTYEIVAHESVHAAKNLFEHINADINGHEPFEYVVGWIAGCCEKAKKSKH